MALTARHILANLKEAPIKNLCLHPLNVCYILNIFGALDHCQTAADLRHGCIGAGLDGA